MTRGGDGVCGVVKTPEVIENHRKKMTGKKLSNEHKKKLSEAMKLANSEGRGLPPVNPSGELHHRYGKHHTDESKNAMSLARRALTTPETIAAFQAGVQTWKDGLSEEQKIELKKRDSKEIHQYDLSGNFIRSFYSIKEASRQTGATEAGIIRCAKGLGKRAGNYIWRYAK